MLIFLNLLSPLITRCRIDGYSSDTNTKVYGDVSAFLMSAKTSQGINSYQTLFVHGTSFSITVVCSICNAIEIQVTFILYLMFGGYLFSVQLSNGVLASTGTRSMSLQFKVNQISSSLDYGYCNACITYLTSQYEIQRDISRAEDE